jgi:hypothetical protein
VDLRELKALELAAKARIAFKGGVWLVPSQTSLTTVYSVTIGDAPSCQCEDFQLRQQTCKHILAAQIVAARNGKGAAPEIVADAVPKRPTYKQDWPLYNEAQQTEKHRFQALLFDLCRGLKEAPRPGPGRQPTPMADQVFAAAFKVYSTVSTRWFACDLPDAHERGYLTKLINSITVSNYLENPALTPIVHALIVQASLPLKAVETVFAPDSTGFSTSRFVRWFDEKYGQERSGHDWVQRGAGEREAPVASPPAGLCVALIYLPRSCCGRQAASLALWRQHDRGA